MTLSFKLHDDSSIILSARVVNPRAHVLSRLPWFMTRRTHFWTNLRKFWYFSSQDSNWAPKKCSWKSELLLLRYLQNNIDIFLEKLGSEEIFQLFKLHRYFWTFFFFEAIPSLKLSFNPQQATVSESLNREGGGGKRPPLENHLYRLTTRLG